MNFRYHQSWHSRLQFWITFSPALAQDKPNILVIWGDDIGIDNVSAYNLGMMGYQTPNIDRIAREGALFTDVYAEQTVPPDALISSWDKTHSAPGF